MADKFPIEPGQEYKIGDTITTVNRFGMETTVFIPDNEVGHLLVAAKRYANSIGAIVATTFYFSDDDELEAINGIEFVKPEQVWG